MIFQNDTLTKIAIDTLRNEKLNQNLECAKAIISESESGMWIPFLSALIGGLLVLAGQFFDRKYKQKIETKNNLREIYAFSRKLEASIKNSYRELAMAKTHIEYWWHCHNDSPTSEKNYEEHLRSQTNAREIEREIGETKAEFIGYVRKFQAIKPLKTEIEIELEKVSNLSNVKAKVYDLSLSHEKVRNELVDKDESELRETYYLNLLPFKEINDYLFTLL
jgi:hypothetical protein